MLEPYKKLDDKERFKRTLGISILTVVLIIWLFAFSNFTILIKLFLTFILIVAGIYQTRRDYKRMKKEESI